MEKRGFTLIELLVVIAIIGILSGVVLASLNTARVKARNAQRISDVRQIQLALEFYFDDQAIGQYPTLGASGLLTPALLPPAYIPTIPKDPVSGKVYHYRSGGTQTSYCFGVELEGAGVAPKNNFPACLQGGGDPNALTNAGTTVFDYAVHP